MSCPDWRHLDPAVRDAPHGSVVGGSGFARSAGFVGAARAANAASTASWEEALRHFDSGCRLCRREALATDPTLAFRHLPPAEMTPAAEAREVELARLAVTAMRAARRLDRHEDRHAPLTLPGRGARRARQLPAAGASRGHGLRWTLAAGLTGLALLTGAEHGWRGAATLGSRTTRDALNGALATSASAASSVAGLAAGASGTRGVTAVDPANAAHAANTTDGAGPAGAGRVLPADLAAVPAANRSSIEGFSRPEARVYQIDGPHMSVVMIVDDKLDV